MLLQQERYSPCWVLAAVTTVLVALNGRFVRDMCFRCSFCRLCGPQRDGKEPFSVRVQEARNSEVADVSRWVVEKWRQTKALTLMGVIGFSSGGSPSSILHHLFIAHQRIVRSQDILVTPTTMGLLSKANLFRFIVLGALVVAVAFGFWVIGSCDFLNNSNVVRGDLNLGVWRYSFLTTDATPPLPSTNGDCVTYTRLSDDTWVKAAQVCAAMAPIWGLILVLMILVTQCCCNIPCSGIIIGLSYVGAQISTALVWLLTGSDVCRWTGCNWGQAATANIIAQILYLVASICHRCMPSPAVLAAERKAGRAEKNEADAEKRADEAEKRVAEAEAGGAKAQVY